MQQDRSYGIIPLKKLNGRWHVFIIKHRSGHWAFPKGHPEAFETPTEAAARELTEESALTVALFWPSDPFIEKYVFHSKQTKIEKTVIYFIAEVEGEVKLQLEEVVEYQWLPVEAAQNIVTFPQAKAICQKVAEEARKKSS